MTGTVREYPVTHCDDGNQATGGPVRVFAAEGQARTQGRIAPPGIGQGQGDVRPPGAGHHRRPGAGRTSPRWPDRLHVGRHRRTRHRSVGGGAGHGRRPGRPGLLRRLLGPGRPLRPARRRRPVRMGQVPGSPGRRGCRAAPDHRPPRRGRRACRTRTRPGRHRGHPHPPGRGRTGFAGRRLAASERPDRPAVFGRWLGGRGGRQPAAGRTRGIRCRDRVGGRPGGGHGPVHRSVRALGRPRRHACRPLGCGGGRRGRSRRSRGQPG